MPKHSFLRLVRVLLLDVMRERVLRRKAFLAIRTLIWHYGMRGPEMRHGQVPQHER